MLLEEIERENIKKEKNFDAHSNIIESDKKEMIIIEMTDSKNIIGDINVIEKEKEIEITEKENEIEKEENKNLESYLIENLHDTPDIDNLFEFFNKDYEKNSFSSIEEMKDGQVDNMKKINNSPQKDTRLNKNQNSNANNYSINKYNYSNVNCLEKVNKDYNFNPVTTTNINNTTHTNKENLTTIANEILENQLENKSESSFIFNGKLFKINKKDSEYIKKDNIKRLVYKCAYNRHEEKLRQELKQKAFGNRTIEYILPNQGIKSGYFIKKPHSNECETMNLIKTKKEIISDNNKEKFITKCN